jgi:hypothetical protein
LRLLAPDSREPVQVLYVLAPEHVEKDLRRHYPKKDAPRVHHRHGRHTMPHGK